MYFDENLGSFTYVFFSKFKIQIVCRIIRNINGQHVYFKYITFTNGISITFIRISIILITFLNISIFSWHHGVDQWMKGLLRPYCVAEISGRYNNLEVSEASIPVSISVFHMKNLCPSPAPKRHTKIIWISNSKLSWSVLIMVLVIMYDHLHQHRSKLSIKVYIFI